MTSAMRELGTMMMAVFAVVLVMTAVKTEAEAVLVLSHLVLLILHAGRDNSPRGIKSRTSLGFIILGIWT